MSYEQMAFTIIAVISVIVFLIPIYKLMKETYFDSLIFAVTFSLIYTLLRNYIKYRKGWRKEKEDSQISIKKISMKDSHGNEIFLDAEDEQSIRKFLNVLEERKAYNDYTKKSEQQ